MTPASDLTTVDRDSVCAGDDVASHRIRIERSDTETLGSLVDRLITRRFLAHISGGRATWVISADGERVGVIAQQWRRPKYLPGAQSRGAPAELHFRYLAQDDPDNALRALRTSAGR